MIACLNSQGMSENFHEIEDFISERKPVVMTLTETHLVGHMDNSEFQIMGYKIIRLDSSSRHTGGVMAYISQEVAVSVVGEYAVHMNYWDLLLKVHLDKNYYIGILYHSPNGKHTEFLNFLENWFEEEITDMKPNFILMGDFNMNWDDCSYNTYVSRLKDIVLTAGLKQVVKKHTRITNSSETMID